MTTAIYARVSTVSQSTDSQLLQCQQWCAQQNIVPRIITDVMSGTKASRPGLDQLMAEARAGRIHTIVIYKLDRIGRSLKNLVAIISELKDLNVALVCTSQPIDTRASNPMGKFILNIMMSICELERDVIVERTKAGLEYARSQNRIGGRPVGYRKHSIPMDHARELLKTHSTRQTAKILAIPESTLRATLASA